MEKIVNSAVGDAVGDAVGPFVGAVGRTVGRRVGKDVGLGLGCCVGDADGDVVGVTVGLAIGAAVGRVVGALVGGGISHVSPPNPFTQVHVKESRSITWAPAWANSGSSPDPDSIMDVVKSLHVPPLRQGLDSQGGACDGCEVGDAVGGGVGLALASAARV